MISIDFQNDALDLHGFDECKSLVKTDQKNCASLEQLLNSVGLKTTEWTPFNAEYFGFQIDNSPVFYPLPACIYSTEPADILIDGISGQVNLVFEKDDCIEEEGDKDGDDTDKRPLLQ